MWIQFAVKAPIKKPFTQSPVNAQIQIIIMHIYREQTSTRCLSVGLALFIKQDN